jgi:hypothetical protein
MTRGDFGRLAGFEQGLAESSRASTEATAEIISRLKSAGTTSRSTAAFQKIYEGEVSRNPSNGNPPRSLAGKYLEELPMTDTVVKYLVINRLIPKQ